MKNLKKLVSVILTVAMLLSSLVALSVSAYSDVDETNTYAKAIEVLSGLGIVKGDEQGNFNPSANIKRSEMVALICRMKGEDAIASSSTQEFDDVAANHWAAGYIKWGVDSEIIKGYGDGRFGPDDNVTLRDAVVMIVRAAGWERIANRSDYGGYPTGHMRIANARGVMDGINYTATDAATREVVAQAIYNGLTMPLVEYISFGENADDDRYAIYDGRATGYELATLLTNTNRIYKVQATVDATAKTTNSLKTATGNKVQLTITDFYDYTDMHADLQTGTLTPYVADSNAEAYLGYTTETYLIKSGANWKILAIVPDDSTESETLSSSEVTFERFTPGTTTTPAVFEYYKSSNDSKTTKIDLVYNFETYYNGKKLDAAAIAALGGINDILVKYANIITFMGDRNADYSKVFVTDYQYVQVEEVRAEDEYIVFDGGVLELNTEDRNDEDFEYAIYDAEGNVMALEDIKEDDILNIVAPEAIDTAPYMDIYVTSDSVTGTVMETLNGPKYKIDGDYYKMVSGTLSNGDAGIFYLTIDGLILAHDTSSSLSKNFAFIVACDSETAFGETTYEIQLFTAEGKLVTLPVASTLKITGTAGGAVTAGSYRRTGSGALQTTIFTQINSLVSDAASTAAAKANLQKRVVTYKTNSNGEVSELLFYGGDLSSANVPSAEYKEDLNIFAGEDLDEKSVLFIAPIIGTALNVDKDDLKVGVFSSIAENKQYNAYKYTFAGDDYLAAAIVDANIASAIEKTHFAVVKTVSSALDADENAVEKFTFVQGGELVELAVDYDKYPSATGLNVGDVFRYTVNAEGEIDAIEYIYDASAEALFTDFDGAGAGSGTAVANYPLANIDTNKIAIEYGKIYDIDNGRMQLVDASGTKLRLNTSEGNTYASVTEETLAGSNPQNAVKSLSGYAALKESTVSREYYVVAIVGETERFEDCVMIIKN